MSLTSNNYPINDNIGNGPDRYFNAMPRFMRQDSANYDEYHGEIDDLPLKYLEFGKTDDIKQPFHDMFKEVQWAPNVTNVPIDETIKQITILLDRSASMSSFNIQKIVESVKNFIKDQIIPGNIMYCTVISFDDNAKIVFDDQVTNIDSVDFTFHDIEPRGGTALTEATAFAIEYTGRKLAHYGTTNSNTRPGKIIFATMTDGEENMSVGDWTGKDGKEKLKGIIKEHTNKYSWNFYLLAANVDSREMGSSMGYSTEQCIDFHTSNDGFDSAFLSASSAINEGRGFSQDERLSSMNPF